jgi:hypothetical protein
MTCDIFCWGWAGFVGNRSVKSILASMKRMRELFGFPDSLAHQVPAPTVNYIRLDPVGYANDPGEVRRFLLGMNL